MTTAPQPLELHHPPNPGGSGASRRYRFRFPHRLVRTRAYGRRVTRPGRWGNPHPTADVRTCELCGVDHTPAEAVVLFRHYAATRDLPTWLADLAEERGIGCTCPIGAACHADVIVELLDATYPLPEEAAR